MDPASSNDDANGTPAEPITMFTIHRMLAQVVEQTNALWQAQASNNRMLDEIRRSMPAPQEHADVQERLHRVEDLVESLARGQRSASHTAAPTHPSWRAEAASGTDQGRTFSGTSPDPTTQTRAATHQTDRIANASDEQCPALHIRDNKGVYDSPNTDPSSGQLGADPTGPALQTRLSEVIPLPIPIGENRDHLLKGVDDFLPSTGNVGGLVPSGIAVPTPGPVSDSSETISFERGQTHQPGAAFGSLHEVDNKPTLSFTTEDESKILVMQLDESLHDRLAVLTTLIQRSLTNHKKEREDPSIAQLQIINEIRQIDAEQKELLKIFLDAWKADSIKQTDDIVHAIRAMANEQVPYNIQGYLDEFSKVLATEVRMLLAEVGSLHEERCSLQREIKDLLTTRFNLVSNGQLSSDELPGCVFPQSGPSPANIPLPESPQRRPAWRTLLFQGDRQAPQPESPTAPGKLASSWTTWQPDPALAPTPPVELTLLLPDRGSPGLFGPRSPCDSPGIPPMPGKLAPSWIAWKPDPALAPTPPVESPLLLPDRGSPGLFGPRSPCDSPGVPPAGDAMRDAAPRDMKDYAILHTVASPLTGSPRPDLD